MTLSGCLLLSCALFAVGLYGLMTRRQVIGVLLSVELMANAANINLVAFSHFRGGSLGQIFALFAMALTVAEVAVGLAIVILVYRAHASVNVDSAAEMSG
ncbi:MAG: NADH-quinone oxidoreductase subunit NuoK [Polyangiaceae bacterium]